MGNLAAHGILLGAASLALLPFAWMLLVSISSGTDAALAPRLTWAWPPDLSHYLAAWQSIPLVQYYVNSLFVAGTVAIGQAVTAVLAGYVFARLHFRGRDALFLIFLGTLLVPNEVTLLPAFLLMRWLGWIDRYQALIVPFLAYPTAIFLLRQFYLTVSTELEDAARIDGCSRLQVLWYLFVPLGRPVIAIVALFSFIWTWKAFLWPLVVIQTPARYTIPVGLAALQSEMGTNWPLMMAATAIATVPGLVLYAAVQRWMGGGGMEWGVWSREYGVGSRE
jgi:multiple sugar transport system permease protein